MKIYKYRWSKNYKVNPQIAGEIFQKCSDDQQVIDLAKNKDHPLHDDFDWNDTSAARAHRVHQARTMRCSLLVEVINKESKAQQIRAFVRNVDRSGYVPTLEATTEELTNAEQQCWRQMSVFKARWKGLEFAHEVIEAINFKEKHLPKKTRKHG